MPEDITIDDNAREDIRLMLRVKMSDARAMEQLINKHKQSVYATVARMLNNHPDCEDIAQEVFIRVWQHADSYNPEAKFTTWMYTILRNLIFNEMRRLKRKPTTSINAIEEEVGDTFPAPAEEVPDLQMQQEELSQVVDQAIADLPENARLAIQLRRFENLPYEEIATILDSSVPAVKSILFRARNTLKEALAKYMDN